jgi:DNA-directed RNA polymerase specialized sigma24 family protein
LEKLLGPDSPKRAKPDTPPFQPWRVEQRMTLQALKQLATDYLAGDPVEVLQERYGLGRASVLRLLDEAGAQKRRKGMTVEQVQRAGQLYGEGSSIREIGAELGVPKTTVQNALVRAGQIMRPVRRVSRRRDTSPPSAGQR